MSRIVQGMSLINHFLGSVLASADIDGGRRPANANANANTNTNTTPPRPTSAPNLTGSRSSPSVVRLPSYLFPRGMTEAIRTSAPTAVRATTPPSTTIPHNAPNKKTEKSSLSNSCTIGESSAASSSSIDNSSKKRKLENEEEQNEDSKKSKNEKGKEKNKKD